MIEIGKAAKHLRKELGLSLRAAASELDISVGHLNKIETGESSPTGTILQRFYDAWGIDLYLLAFAKFADREKLPREVRTAADNLAAHWEKRIDQIIAQRKASIPPCSTSKMKNTSDAC